MLISFGSPSLVRNGGSREKELLISVLIHAPNFMLILERGGINLELVMRWVHGVFEDVNYLNHFRLRLFDYLVFGALENPDLLFGAEPYLLRLGAILRKHVLPGPRCLFGWLFRPIFQDHLILIFETLRLCSFHRIPIHSGLILQLDDLADALNSSEIQCGPIPHLMSNNPSLGGLPTLP